MSKKRIKIESFIEILFKYLDKDSIYYLLKDLNLLTENVKKIIEKNNSNYSNIGIYEILSMIKLINAKLEVQEKRIIALERALENALDLLDELERAFLLKTKSR